MTPSSTWNAYEKLVLEKLDNHSEQLACLTKKVTDLRVELARLQIKAGLWGTLAGGVSSLVVAILAWLKYG